MEEGHPPNATANATTNVVSKSRDTVVRFAEDVTAISDSAGPGEQAPTIDIILLASEGNPEIKSPPSFLCKLFTKLLTRLSSNMSSSSPAAERHNSLTGSFKSALSNLKRNSTNASNNSDKSTPTKDIFDIPPDSLPDNPRDLEGLLNRHLSALDHLKRTVDGRNKEIKDYGMRAAMYHDLRPKPSVAFLRQVDAEMYVLRQQRNGLQPLVQMRHNEIVRIADHRKKLDREQGQECTVYDMYLGYRHVEEWEQRFSY